MNKAITTKSRLMQVQQALKAPKDKNNNFGGYKYRKAEDILEQAKPLLEQVGAIITINDEIVQIGDRYYVKATAYFEDIETPDGQVYASAYAREPLDRKGMDAAQVTGASSTYARKYALCGLLAIDDSKDDPDAQEIAPNARKSENNIIIQEKKESAANAKKSGNNDDLLLDGVYADIDAAENADQLRATYKTYKDTIYKEKVLAHITKRAKELNIPLKQ